MNDTNEIRSIWDGWERQVNDASTDDGECALNFLFSRSLARDAWIAVGRVGEYIQRTMNPPMEWWPKHAVRPQYPATNEYDAVMWANDVLRLTPDQFRQIEINLQVEAVSKPLIESVEIAVGVGR